jgi:hypothetical protein
VKRLAAAGAPSADAACWSYEYSCYAVITDGTRKFSMTIAFLDLVDRWDALYPGAENLLVDVGGLFLTANREVGP